MLRATPPMPQRAARISDLAKDITEFLAGYELGAPKRWSSLRVAYHSACSLQHGQRITDEPKALLSKAGLRRRRRAGRPHLLRLGRHLQHPAAGDRRAADATRKAKNIDAFSPIVVAAGNIGCITQLAGRDLECPSCIRSSCWIGPTAAQFPAAWRSWRSSFRTCRSPIASRKSISTRDLRIRPAGPTP